MSDLSEGDVPIDSFYWSDQLRFKRIGTSSVLQVDENGKSIGHALALIYDYPIQRIETESED